MTTISGSDRFITVDGVDLNEVPDGYVIYDNSGAQVHYLNTTAAVVYQLLDGQHTVDKVAHLLKLAFNREEDVEITSSIESMLEAKLICRVD